MRQEVARLPLRDDGGFLSVEASVAGHPVRLMLDTGSDAGLVLPQALQALGLAAGDSAPIRLHGTGGSRSAGQVLLPDLALGALHLGDVRVPVGALPGAPSLRPPVIGFLGGDVLSQFDLDIDIPHATLALYEVALPSLACAPPPAWSGPYRTEILTRHGVRLSLPARLDGHAISALLDTGARSRIVSERTVLRFGIGAGELAADAGGLTSGVDMREQPYHWHRFASLTVAGTTALQPVLTVAPLSEPFDMLLGTDWLAAQRVWISYSTNRLFMVPK
nr:retroviral-like aspartic protease family protein [uncultured Lichenicoccus sp.]